MHLAPFPYANRPLEQIRCTQNITTRTYATKKAKHLSLEGRRSRDNLNEFSGDSCLARSVILQVELAEHLSRVLGGVLHRTHARRLLRGGVIHKSVVHLSGHCVLVEVLQGLGVIVWLHLVLEEERGSGVQQSKWHTLVQIWQ